MNLIKCCFYTAVMFLFACTNEGDVANKPPIQITLAAEMSLLPSTVWVAEELGFFKKQGITLSIREFDSGRNALETMLKDHTINISTVAQTPIVFNSFNNENYSIVATMAYSLDDIKVLGRKDHGVTDAKSLKSKKIGATERSTGHYFLESYLAHYGMTIEDVNLIDINASKLLDTLVKGDVDAITSWEPHIHNAEVAIGEGALSMLVSPTPFRKDFFFTTSKEYAVEKKEHVKRFLSALIEAEEYIIKKPEQSKKIVAARLKADIDLIDRIWDSFTFAINLEQSILVNLENEAQWAIKLSGNKEKIPNYLSFINIDPLLEIKPDSVNLLH